ncbi:MAG: FAD:protein FMN transferase [Oscillospiraceae bacterium]|nr:FAD:protein FMN transferase [Oscillospiraceae bacterium]
MKQKLPLLILAVFVVGALAVGLVSTFHGTNEPVETDFFAMDTLMGVQVYSRNADADGYAVQTCIGALEKELSVTIETSEIAQLNRDGHAVLTGDVQALLQRTIALSARTGGALDPTMYSIVRLWGFTTGSYRVPDGDEIAAALETVGTAHITLGENGDTALLGGAQIDFGAVAKGYAAQQSADLLAARGVTAAILSLGGNVQTVGSRPDGNDWVIGIRDPADEAQMIGKLSVSGSAAIVTSGGYQRYFEENGVTYQHIMDPATGAPVKSGLSSVTIVAQDGFLADGLSTALYVMGLDKATAFWRDSDDFEAVLITDDGDAYVTEGLAGRYVCADGFTVVTR